MVVGPCQPYYEAAVLLADPRCEDLEAPRAAAIAAESSETMYVLLGRQFPGTCSATVRPVRREAESFMGRGLFNGATFPFDTYSPSMSAILGVPACDDGDPITLAPFTREVTDVLVDGETFTDWALVDGKLYRTDGKRWPSRQKVWKPDTEPGTFSFTYTFGPDTPAGVAAAAKELGVQTWLSEIASTACAFPPGTTSVSRQGQSVSIADRVAQAREAGPTIPIINNAMGTWNPTNQRQPPDIYSTADAWDLHVVQATGS